MKICAVICEYDPFHSGHEYLIKRVKAMGYDVVCIMSGSFTQRGTPAVISKYERAKAAVLCGANLVLELPFPYCSLGAASFAEAGVYIAEKLGCVSALAFGSENGNVEELKEYVNNITTEEFISCFENEGKDERFDKRVGDVYKKLFDKQPRIGSNDLLATEYLKALKKLKSSILPIAIKREGQDFNSKSGEGFSSATSIRKKLFCGDLEYVKQAVPAPSYEMIDKNVRDGAIAREERLFLPYTSVFRMKEAADLFGFAEINEELASRIVCSAGSSTNYVDLIENTKTKMFSQSRIRRAMLMAFTEVYVDKISSPVYSVLLGADTAGRKILSQITKNSDFTIITKPADNGFYGEKVKDAFKLLLRAEALWALLLDNPRDSAVNMRLSPFIAEGEK